jgi:amino acid transporter, AAT family
MYNSGLYLKQYAQKAAMIFSRLKKRSPSRDRVYQRGLHKRHVNMIALGGIIGSSYFLGTGLVFQQVGPLAFLGYVFGGIITYITMACLAELTVGAPTAGSFITYTKKYLSPSLACGVGWAYWFGWVTFIPSECLAGGMLMELFVPGIHPFFWAFLFAIVITVVNCLHVKAFGEVEFWLSLVKITLIAVFSVMGVGIFFGWVGSEQKFIGLSHLIGNGGVFPKGFYPLLLYQVILLGNFQGSEIIGLSAAESEDPEKNIPDSLNKIAVRIIGLYVIPTLILALIFPWNKASVNKCIFSEALEMYGFQNIAAIFTFFVLSGAISSANGGVYATARSLHAMASRKMAPVNFGELSIIGVPLKATLFTLVAIWTILLISLLFPSSNIYVYLLALSGFTGSLSWIAICLSQYKYRMSLKEKNEERLLKYKVSFFPNATLICAALQILCLLVLVFTPKMQGAFVISMLTCLVPMALYKWIVGSNHTID